MLKLSFGLYFIIYNCSFIFFLNHSNVLGVQVLFRFRVLADFLILSSTDFFEFQISFMYQLLSGSDFCSFRFYSDSVYFRVNVLFNFKFLYGSGFFHKFRFH
jgi:hypothetical protein